MRKITGTKLLLDPRLDAVWIPVQRWKNYQILSLFYIESGMRIFELPEITGKVQELSLNTDETIITIKKIYQNQTSEMQLDLQPNMLSWKIKFTEIPKKNGWRSTGIGLEPIHGSTDSKRSSQ